MGFEIGDLVWAKMKNFPPWPAQIVEKNPKIKEPKLRKPHQFVYFYGTKDYAWISEKDIFPHSDTVLDTLNKKKSKMYQQAIDEFLDCIKTKKVEEQASKVKDRSESERKSTKVVKIIKVENKKRSATNSKVKKVYRKRNEFSLKKNSEEKSLSSKRSEIVNNSGSSSSSSPSFDLPECSFSTMDLENLDDIKKIGFMGLNELSIPVLVRLVEHIDVTLLKTDVEEHPELPILDKVKILNTPAELIMKCDVVFSYYFIDSEEDASFKEVIFGENGIIVGLDNSEKMKLTSKGYVGLHSILEELSNKINEAVTAKNGYYLEAPMIGTIPEAMQGELIILASGHRRLFALCKKIFKIMSSTCRFVSCELGTSSKYSVILNTVNASLLEAAAENMALSEKLNIQKSDFTKILQNLLESNNFNENIKKMSDQDYSTVVTPLKHTAMNINLGMMMANSISHPMPLTAAANELYKRAKLLNYSDCDVSLIYKVLGAPPKKDKREFT